MTWPLALQVGRLAEHGYHIVMVPSFLARVSTDRRTHIRDRETESQAAA
jgi:hypothetical protein